MPLTISLLGDPAGEVNVNAAIDDSPSCQPNATSAGSSPVAKFAQVTAAVEMVAAKVADPPPLEQFVNRPWAVIVCAVGTLVNPGLKTKRPATSPHCCNSVACAEGATKTAAPAHAAVRQSSSRTPRIATPPG